MLAQAPCSDWGEGANVPAGYREAPAPPRAPLPKLPCQAPPAELLAAPTSRLDENHRLFYSRAMDLPARDETAPDARSFKSHRSPPLSNL